MLRKGIGSPRKGVSGIDEKSWSRVSKWTLAIFSDLCLSYLCRSSPSSVDFLDSPNERAASLPTIAEIVLADSRHGCSQ